MASPDTSGRRGRGRPATGKALAPAERMRRMRARKKASGLKASVSWVPARTMVPPYSPHRLLEARSLAMHAVIAEKIQRDPRLLEVARQNLDRWEEKWGADAPRWVGEWRSVLRRAWPEIAAIITESSESATRLRQSTPFAGVLTAAERRRIYEAFRA